MPVLLGDTILVKSADIEAGKAKSLDIKWSKWLQNKEGKYIQATFTIVTSKDPSGKTGSATAMPIFIQLEKLADFEAKKADGQADFTVVVDTDFQFGQKDDKGTGRWLCFHDKTREINQGRFVKNAAKEAGDRAAEVAKQLGYDSERAVSGSLQGGVANAWGETIPSGTHAELVLEKKQFVVKFPERKAVFFQVRGRWGPAKGNIALYVHHLEKQPIDFIVVASLSTLDCSEIFNDVELATEVKNQLSPSTADICVLRDWPGLAGGNSLIIPGKVKHALDVIHDLRHLTPLEPCPIDNLPILDNAALKDISLALTVTRPASSAPANVNLKLTGTLVLGVFNSKKPWASTGTLTIDKASHAAELVVTDTTPASPDTMSG
ncbi:hypothetical protein NMY22_g17545 [Coprinellus aureogranulatus]|nr:hypothetical protein NMY22_g17545 [Coprinellus aureogranulatus]